MISQQSLGIEEAQRAIAAVLEEAGREGKAMSVAVVDNHGELLAAARMNGSHARVLKHAIRKAYTAATMGRDTLSFKHDLWERDGNLDEWGDATLTTLQAGLVAMVEGQIVGAIGCGGNSLPRDEEVARIGLRAMGIQPVREKPQMIENGHDAAGAARLAPVLAGASNGGRQVATARKILTIEGSVKGTAPAGTRFGDLVFSSTIVGIDPKTGLLGEGPEQQLEFAYQNMRGLCNSAGVTTDNIAHVTNFIRDPSMRAYLNKPWLAMFPDENNRPARKTTAYEMPGNQLIVLQMLAVAGQKRERLELPGRGHRDPLPNGVKLGNMVYSSVLTGQDPATGKNIEDPKAAIDQCFNSQLDLLRLGGGSDDNILHHWVFMSDFDFQPYMVDVYLQHFPEFGNRPARKTVRYDTSIQQQFIGVLGERRENFEIPGVSHHDPIPMSCRMGNIVMSSGMGGDDPTTGKVPDGLEAQAEGTFANMQRMVEIAGGKT
ncbi:MAG TPA: heme-binding protein, partial [Dehalococcoidia bacterium]|nr:heme-binding protein [Dehalococcoidia bacterium]